MLLQGISRYSSSILTLPQELAEGRSLGDLVRSGWRADEAEVVRIGRELLQILQYLSSRRPPVVHRLRKLAQAHVSQASLNSQNPICPACAHQLLTDVLHPDVIHFPACACLLDTGVLHSSPLLPALGRKEL